MKLLVTGASGFLGAFVVREALKADHSVIALARSTAAADKVRALGAKPLLGDLSDPWSLDDAFVSAAGQGAEVLVNLPSLGFGHAASIVAAAEDAGLRRAVFVSTTAVTTSLPATSKRIRLAAEQTIRDSELDWTILRPTMIYGTAGDRNISRLLALLRHTPVLPVPGGGRRLQQPVHVQDLARAVVAATVGRVAVGNIYDIAGPDPLTFRELLAESAAAVGRRTRLLPVPLRPAIWALRAYEQTVPRPRLKSEQLERLAEDKAFDIGPAVNDLGYRPRSFRDGVRAQVAASWT